MSSSPQLRIGIVGAARVAVYAVIEPARSMERVKVAAVTARDPSRAAAYAAEHGIARVHKSYSDLLADSDIDIVYLATPPSLHAEQAIKAIESGKSVLVEKPFSMNAQEAQEVYEFAQRRGVRVFEAMHSPHHALFQRAVEIVRSGEIGDVRHVDAEFSVGITDKSDFRWNVELGGGALMDLGVYPLAWTRRLLGDVFSVVEAECVSERGVDARFEASLHFASGATAAVRSSMTPPQPCARLLVEGSLGRLEVINPLCPQIGHALHVSSSEGSRTEVIEGRSTYEEQLLAVCATLLDGISFPFPPDDFVRSMKAIDSVRTAWKIRDIN